MVADLVEMSTTRKVDYSFSSMMQEISLCHASGDENDKELLSTLDLIVIVLKCGCRKKEGSMYYLVYLRALVCPRLGLLPVAQPRPVAAR
jgi:hypothetical protein